MLSTHTPDAARNDDMMRQTSVGGVPYEKKLYVIRVAESYANTRVAPKIKNVKDTEAVLHKLGAQWDFELISIHNRDGRVFTGKDALRDYLHAQGVNVFFNPTTYAEVFVPCPSSYWKSWDMFLDNSKLAEGAPVYVFSQEADVLPLPFELMLATYEIRHHKNTAPGLCETKKRAATLTIQDIDDHYIKDELGGQHYFSLAHWHLMNPFATEEDIAKDLATNGSPWSHIDVKVGCEWMTGCTFLAQRRPARPGDNGRVPRSNGATIYDDYPYSFDYDATAFEDAFINRDSLNLSVTEIMERFGPGIPEGYTFDDSEFIKEFERSYLNPENYWDEMTFAEVMYNYGPRPPLSHLS